MNLHTLDRLPHGFLDASARTIADLLPGPTLIHLDGTRRPPLFVSLLLHGDETTGLVAVQEVLRRHASRGLPRALSLFVGNVHAARAGVRRLPGQRDFNRVWPGGPESHTAEGVVMREVVDAMRRREVFASIDVHNNSGLNPHYACVNQTCAPFLQLARLFSRTVVFFSEPRGVQSLAFAALCPAVTVECGRAESADGESHAADFIDSVLCLSHFPEHPPAPHDLDLFHTEAIVKVPPEVSLAFGDRSADVMFREDLDHLNFSELTAGTPFGRLGETCIAPLLVTVGDDPRNHIWDYFDRSDGLLTLRRAAMPAMLTRSEAAIRQDCLCYLMVRLDAAGASPG
jgi:succinylglutamate desuccinylase